MSVFISAVVASVRPANITALLRNLDDTVADPGNIEVLVKLKDTDEATRKAIEDYRDKVRFAVKYVASPEREGYYSLNEGYDELFAIADPETYFFWLLNDEVRVETKGWDEVLKKYVKIFPDDIFRLKLSLFKLKNYYSMFECFPCPDNYALTTKKWLNVTGGWGEFWAGDAWHQAVEYYLGAVRGGFARAGHHRGVPVFGVELSNEAAGRGIEGDALLERHWRVARGWQSSYTRRSRETLNRLAHRLFGHITATEQKYTDYLLVEDRLHKSVTVCRLDGTIVARYSYRLSLVRQLMRLILRRYPVVGYWRSWTIHIVQLQRKKHGLREQTKKAYYRIRAAINAIQDRLGLRPPARLDLGNPIERMGKFEHIYLYRAGVLTRLERGDHYTVVPQANPPCVAGSQ